MHVTLGYAVLCLISYNKSAHGIHYFPPFNAISVNSTTICLSILTNRYELEKLLFHNTNMGRQTMISVILKPALQLLCYVVTGRIIDVQITHF